MGVEPWWVAKDVAIILGISDPQTIIDRLDEDEHGSTMIIDVIECRYYRHPWRTAGNDDYIFPNSLGNLTTFWEGCLSPCHESEFGFSTQVSKDDFIPDGIWRRS